MNIFVRFFAAVVVDQTSKSEKKKKLFINASNHKRKIRKLKKVASRSEDMEKEDGKSNNKIKTSDITYVRQIVPHIVTNVFVFKKGNSFIIFDPKHGLSINIEQNVLSPFTNGSYAKEKKIGMFCEKKYFLGFL